MTRAHFSDEEWTDYVRGTLSSAPRSDLQSHLDAGCGSCRGLHDLWRAIQQTAPTALRGEPTEQSTRIARALFGLHTPKGQPMYASQMVELLFDSRLVTAHGFRSASATSRKFVYAVGKYVLDIQLQDDEKGRPTLLLGQVTPQDGVDPSVEGSPVLLLREMQVIARATMNRIGEFQLEFDGYATGTSLALGLKRGGTVIKLDISRTES